MTVSEVEEFIGICVYIYIIILYCVTSISRILFPLYLLIIRVITKWESPMFTFVLVHAMLCVGLSFFSFLNAHISLRVDISLIFTSLMGQWRIPAFTWETDAPRERMAISTMLPGEEPPSASPVWNFFQWICPLRCSGNKWAFYQSASLFFLLSKNLCYAAKRLSGCVVEGKTSPDLWDASVYYDHCKAKTSLINIKVKHIIHNNVRIFLKVTMRLKAVLFKIRSTLFEMEISSPEEIERKKDTRQGWERKQRGKEK